MASVPIVFKMRSLLFYLSLVFLSHLGLNAQIAFSGKVVDHTSNEPLIGATILLHEIERGDISNINGEFRISNLRPASYHLHISYLGYHSITKLLKLSKDTTINFQMEPTSLELKEIVVESNHYKTGPKEQTLAIEVIDAEMLKKNRKGTLVNTLEDIPGINAINTGVGISKPVIRGLSFNRVIVNDKGVKQEGQQWGSDHGLEIDMFEPGRVEVIKGPNSLLYGSDGLGGVLNIFPPALPQKKGGNFQAMYKSNNYLYATSTMIEGINKGNMVYRLRVSTQDFADYGVPAESFSYNGFDLELFDNRLKNTAGKERNFSGMIGWKKDWGYSTLTVSNFYQKAGLFAGAIGVPRSYQLTSDGNIRNIDFPRQVNNHFKVISNTNLLLGKNWLELDIGYQNNNRKEESPPHAHGKGPRPEGNLAHNLKLQTWSLTGRYFQHPNERRTRILGLQAEYQKNNRDGFEFLLAEYDAFALGSFIYEELSWKKLTATGGLRFDYANRNIQSFEEPIYSDETTIDRYYQRNGDIDKTFMNFSGALGLSYYPSQMLNLKLNLGSSFKVPTAAELSLNGIHHGTFRHELGDSTLTSEQGFQADFVISFQKNNFSLVASPFVSFYDGFIYLAPSSSFSSSLDPDAFPEGGQIYQYRQNDAFFAGGELALEYHPLHDLHLKTALEYVYNYNLDTYLPLPFTPPPSIVSEINYHIPIKNRTISEVSVGFNHRKAWDQNRVDRNERTTPGYSLIGITTGTNISYKSLNLEVYFSIQNLTNEKFFNHLSRYRLLNLPEQGRNFTFSMVIPFAI